MDPDRSLEGNCSHRLTSERPTKNSDSVAAEARQIAAHPRILKVDQPGNRPSLADGNQKYAILEKILPAEKV